MTEIYLIVREDTQDGDSFLFHKLSSSLEEAQAFAQTVVDEENNDYVDNGSSDIEREKAKQRLQWNDCAGSYWSANEPLGGDRIKIYRRELPAQAGAT